jgi:hypothetical protein
LQAHIDELEAAREHDSGLAERLRLAEIKIVGLENEIEDLKQENAALRQRLAAALADPGPIPECLVRKPMATGV